MKRILLLAFVLLQLFILNSCASNPKLGEIDSSTEAFAEIQVSETPGTITSAIESDCAQSSDYSVGVIDTSVSFDEMLMYFVDYYEIDSNDFESQLSEYHNYATDDNYLLYDADDQVPDVYIDEGPVIVDETGSTQITICHYPREEDYHFLRELTADLRFHCREFDDDAWAEHYFLSWVDCDIEEITSFNNSSVENGYYFTYDGRKFTAVYHIEKCVIWYDFVLSQEEGVFTVDSYERYLEWCEEFGLPTCDEMTEIVLG